MGVVGLRVGMADEGNGQSCSTNNSFVQQEKFIFCSVLHTSVENFVERSGKTEVTVR
jgi:hypothetical protein